MSAIVTSHLLRVLHVWIIVLVVAGTIRAKVDGDVRVLERLTVLHSANLARLRTWTGIVDIEQHSTGGDRSLIPDIISHVRFAVDRDTNTWCYVWIYDSSTNNELNGFQSAGMMLQNAWYTYPAYRPSPNQRQAVAIRASQDTNIGPLTAAIDPMSFFKARGNDIVEEIGLWTTHADSDWLDLTIRQEGEVITVEPINVTIPNAKSRYVFDLSTGGCIVALYAEDSIRKETWKVQWKQLSDVWVPNNWSYQNETINGEDVNARTIKWRTSLVNHQISGDEFGMDEIGVLPGALVTDHRTMTLSHYKSDDSDHHRDLPTVRKPATRSYSLLLVIINVAVVLLLSGAAVWRHRHALNQGKNP
jgi:hypothetical protein